MLSKEVGISAAQPNNHVADLLPAMDHPGYHHQGTIHLRYPIELCSALSQH